MKEIKFKLVTGIMLIPARADGVEGFFVLDTGAMQTTLNKNYFPEIEGEEISAGIFDESPKNVSAFKAEIHELSFGSISLSNLPVVLLDMSYVENALRESEPDIRFLGSVGIEIFENLPILLDYERSVITVEPDICTDGAEKLPLFAGALPTVDLEFSDGSHRFILDTGAECCLISKDLTDKISVEPFDDFPKNCVIPEIKVGSHSYRNIEAVSTDISQIRTTHGVDGLIGYQILSKQLSLLDFPNNALYLF